MRFIRQTISSFIKLSLLLLVLGWGSSAWAKTLLIYKGAYQDYYGGADYDSVGGWSEILDDAFGSANITVTTDSSLDAYTTENITDFDAILVETGDFNDSGDDDALSVSDKAKLNAFIATGKRVFLVGDHNSWSTWNTSITSLTAMDSATTVSSGDDSYDVLTTDASTITYAAAAAASGTNGTALFGNRISVIWGDSSNVLTVLDMNFNEDRKISNTDNSQYATNNCELVI